jgi:hypothetical protein
MRQVYNAGESGSLKEVIKMKPIVGLIVLIGVLFMGIPGVIHGEISADEKEALNALNAFIRRSNPSEWEKMHGWKGDDWSRVAEWEGITIKENKVTGIDLSSKGLSGEIPGAVKKLGHLEVLVLRYNKLTKIPKELEELSKLRELVLNDNRLEGSIPKELGKLTNLTHLKFADNELSGPIPAELGNLSKLVELDLSDNKLSGPIPAQLGNLSNLKLLNLSKNKLTGDIPGAVLKLKNFQKDQPDFSWNALEDKKWRQTQTTAPWKIYAKALGRNTIKVSWQDIPCVSKNGDYRVYCRRKDGLLKNGYGKVYSWRKNSLYPGKEKQVRSVKIGKLEPSTTYCFRVQSVTGPHENNKNEIISQMSDEESASTGGATISGVVKLEDGSPVEGVKVEASDCDENVETDAGGKYNLSVEYEWKGSLTLSKPGYKFSPDGYDAKKLEKVIKDIKNQNFKAKKITTISGKIKNLNGKGIGGVELVFSDQKGNETGRVVTDKNGNYSHTVEPGWNGTVKPAKKWFSFEPKEKSYEQQPLFSEKENQDFEALVVEISGQVKVRKRKGLKGVVKLTFVNDEKTPEKLPEGDTQVSTHKNGEYSRFIPVNWQGTIIPKREGYIFYKKKRLCKNMGPGTPKKPGNVNFRAELDWKFFISAAGNYMIPSEKKISDVYGIGLMGFEIKTGYKFSRSFYIWGGYGFSTKKGYSTPNLERPAVWNQRLLSLGLGYNKNVSIAFDLKAEVGIFHVSYREEAFGERVSGNALGPLRINGTGIYKISDYLSTEIALAYLWAPDTKNGINLELGGFKTGIGLGVRF